ncbi:hypothetical protein ABZV93_27425 [Actinopolymorpha sp. NPDC004070]|uniref:hypothetical protein n=1 Tax=Actinopolymorpha sp. NPDC004070 TaxID=3154548 RepID=UPI0033BDF7E8
MLDVATAATVFATPMKVGVERLECLGIESADLALPQDRTDVLGNLPLVALTSAGFDIDHFH